MGSLFSAPKAPDPAATAQAQSQANAEAVRESAKVNAIDQVTPQGTVTFTRDDAGVPTQQVTSLTPTGQDTFERQQDLALALTQAGQNQLQYLPSEQFTLEQFGASPAATDFGAQAGTVQQAAFDRGLGLLNPQFERQNDALENTIEQRGLDFTGENATTLRSDQQRNQNEALNALQNQAILAGGAEQNRLFGLEQQARQQGINEALLQRTQPINELAALLQGAPAIGAPQAQQLPFQQIAAPDIAGLTQNQFNQQNANAQANRAGLFGLGSAAIGLSDRRVKENIVKIGYLPHNGLNVYSYNYIWSKQPQVGVMAQEVAEVIPDAVVNINGILAVDYAMVI